MDEIAVVRIRLKSDVDYIRVRCMVYHDIDQIIHRVKRKLMTMYDEIPDDMEFIIVERNRIATKKS